MKLYIFLGESVSQSIVVIGIGNMGSSLVNGLLKSPLKSQYKIKIYDLHQERQEMFRNLSECEVLESLANLKDCKDVIILCIKPHDLDPLAQTLKGALDKNLLILSIMAGVTTEVIQSALDFKGSVIRAMPNIAATIGKAATAMCSHNCTSAQQELAEGIFKAVGEAYWTKESLMDAVTGLSGSGPAYIYMVIEALTDGGVKMGLPRTLAAQLATQTVLGAAALVKQTGEHPAILKDQVTTPAGTTISALHELEERGMRSMFVSAVEKATLRSSSLRS